jgi:molecular chaperone HscB
MMSDYFEVFDLPRRLQVDLDALQGRFYELSRRHHPDFHQEENAATQARALEASALVNRAYRTLRDPVARVEYLIALEEGREVREETAARPKPPVGLLEEMLEVQEALEEAKAAGLTAETSGRLRAERQRLEARRRAEEDALIAGAAEWDAAADAGGDRSPLIERFKRSLAARAYLRTAIDDLVQALGEDEGSHVAYRRH